MTCSDRPVLTALLALVAGSCLLSALGSPPSQSATLVADLVRQQRFSAAEVRSLDAGEAIVKSLDTPVRRELAHLGVVHINAPIERFVDRFTDIERFERGPGVPQIGRLSDPPRPDDLASLKLPAKDLSALAKCHPGDCDVKLSAAAMTRFRKQVDWSSTNPSLQAHNVLRELIVEVVKAYQAGGNPALGRYEDRPEPVDVAEQFRALLTSKSPLPLAVPELITYLNDYPRNRPVGAQDLFYWSVVNFGLKPTLRVNHVVIYPLPAKPSGVSHVIAIKQLYASHYFHTTLELRFLVADERRSDRPGFYLLSITRSRSDGTTGLTGSFLRPVISRRSRNAVRSYLEHLKRQVERTDPGLLF